MFIATRLKISLNFTRNTAAQKGGAIYVEDGPGVMSVFDLQCDTELVQMTFSNNSALLAGNHIYGGWVDWFKNDESGYFINGFNTTEKILKFERRTDSDVASDPIRVCLCESGQPDCNITNHTMQVYGDAANLEVVAVGQRHTPVAAFVKASLDYDSSESKCDEEIWKHLSPRIASIPATCTRITYKFNVPKETVVLELQSDLNNNYCVESELTYSHDVLVLSKDQNLFQQLYITVKRMRCPLGFYLDRIDGTCKCNQLYKLICDLIHTKINRTELQWIGVTYEHTIVAGPGVILYNPCPFYYCRTDKGSLSINLEDQDVICDFNRSSILCGGCKTNFSRVLGSSKCSKCTNNIPVIIALFLGQALFGPLLIISLMFLDLTVAVGTINALTFYTNIIQAQSATFFTQDTSSSFLSMFTAWLNLDHGIEMCLYDGLDGYAVTWLKVPFPLYIWFLTGTLICLSHYSLQISRHICRNSVQVLATLFLISYAKLLRLIIDVFSYALLTYPNGRIKRVWLVDGNVEYFKGKHIPLLLITTLYIVVTLPYTFILLTIQFLYKISHYRVMFWIQRLKPFFDAYTGPYKANHRYWTGLLLVVRITLLVTFFFYESIDSSINLLMIVIISFVLVGWFSLAGGVYESWLNNFLEIVFLCNLGITSATVFFDKQNTKIAVFTSTTVAFIIFVCIVLCHALNSCYKPELV